MAVAIRECPSRIEHVTVYARGALVRRSVKLPAELPAETVELEVGGLTVLAEAGSARAVVEGGRAVSALAAEYVLPAGPAAPGAPVERIRTLDLERQSLDGECLHLQALREALAQLSWRPRLG